MTMLMNRPLRQALLLPLLIQVQSSLSAEDTTAPTFTTTNAYDYTCDWSNDSCEYAVDEECDASSGGICGRNTDCYDCDPLKQFRYNCDACVKAGGYWCPQDASCLSQPLAGDYFASILSNSGVPRVSGCPLETDWQTSCDLPAYDDNVFTDPLYDAMKWEYQLINVEKVWRQLGITGKGVSVRITDDGVDGTHPEFSERFDLENSCPNFDGHAHENHGMACASIIGAEADNDLCAVGIAPGATLSACDNTLADGEGEGAILLYKIGAVDVSSNSWGPLPCESTAFEEDDDDDYEWDDDDLPDGGWDDDDAADDSVNGWFDDDDHTDDDSTKKKKKKKKKKKGDSRRRRKKKQRRQLQCLFQFNHPDYGNPCDVCGDTMDLANDDDCRKAIVEHCYFYYDSDTAACIEYLDLFVDCEYHTLELAVQDAFHRAITEGRQGKGVVFVFPAGNEHEYGSNGNLDGFVNSRLTISVGAVDKFGKRAAYSTPGAPVFVTAPAGDEEFLSNQITASFGGGCIDAGIGTSFSTPTVAGVVALLLEANTNLTWRDVQGVLAATAQHNDPEEPHWSTNAAGFHHNYYYGFGLVDAFAAVTLAQAWKNWGPEQQLTASSGSIDLEIADASSNTTATTSVVSLAPDLEKHGGGIVLESVVVYVDLIHGSRGDLAIKLISPEGTESLLAPGKRPEETQLHQEQEAHWKLMTVRNWGESPYGDWTLEIIDEKEGSLSDCLDLPFDYQGAANDDDDNSLVDNDDDNNDDGTSNATDNDDTVRRRRRRARSRNLDWALDEDWTCKYLVDFETCQNGEVLDELANQVQVQDETGTNVTGAEACCACGGGLATATLTHVLKSWRIVAYGHEPTTSTAASQANSSIPAAVEKSASAIPPNKAKETSEPQPASTESTVGAAALVEGLDFSPMSGSCHWCWGASHLVLLLSMALLF